MLRVSSPITMPSANQYAPSPYGVVLYDQLTEEKKDGTWFTDCSAIYVSIKQKVTAAALQPLSVTILRNIGKEKLLQWAELWILCRVIHFVWKELMARCVIFH